MSAAGDGPTCRNCGVVFPSKNALHRHIRTNHQASASKEKSRGMMGGAFGGGLGMMGGGMGMGVGGVGVVPTLPLGIGGIDQHMLPSHVKIKFHQVSEPAIPRKTRVCMSPRRLVLSFQPHIIRSALHNDSHQATLPQTPASTDLSVQLNGDAKHPRPRLDC